MKIWKNWTMATLVGTFAGAPVAALGSISRVGGFFIFLIFLSPVTVPITQWFWMRRIIPAFSRIWIPVCFVSLIVSYGTAFALMLGLGALEILNAGYALLVLLVSGVFLSVIQEAAIRRTFSLDKDQRRILGAKWTVSTMIGWLVIWSVGMFVGWLDWLVSGRTHEYSFGFFIVLAPTSMAACQGYVLHRVFDGQKDDASSH